MANNERTVDLIVRARDQYSAVLKNLKQMQTEVAANSAVAMKRMAIENRNALDQTRADITKLSGEFNRLTKAQGNNRAEIARVVVEKAKLRARALELQAALGQMDARTRSVTTSQKSGFGAFIKMAEGMDVSIAKAQRLEQEIRDLDAAQQASYAKNARYAGMKFGGFAAQEALRDADRYGSAAQDKRAELAGLAAGENAYANSLRMTSVEANQATTQLNKLNVEKQKSAALADHLETQMRELAAAIERAGMSARDRFITDELQRATVAAERLGTELTQVQAAALRLQAGTLFDARNPTSRNTGPRRGDSGGRRGEDQDVELYGLRPYQMVNLGYQVNDVISGLAMGQAPIQILAQQAGQFAQIWPNVMVGLVRSLPVIAGVTAALSPFIGAIIQVVSQRQALEDFTRRLDAMADGARYSAEALTAITRNWAELEPLLEAGFNQDQLAGFYELAELLSAANGEDIATNVARLAEAFKGGVDGVRELDREIQFLTADQYESIRAMEAQGDEAGAMELAQQALQERYASFSREAGGPWRQAFVSLGNAWKGLVSFLADTAAIRLTIGVFDLLGKSVAGLVMMVEDLVALLPDIQIGPDYSGPGGQLRQQRDVLQETLSQLEGTAPGVFVSAENRDSAIENLKEQITLVETQIAAIEAANAATVEGASAAADTAAATEEELKNRQDMLATIDAQVEALRQEATLAQMTARERFVETQLLEARNRAIEAGIELSEQELEVLRAQAGVTFDRSQGPSGNLVDRIIGVESGGNANVQNPNSTATGLGQFISSTWLAMFERYFPARAAAMGREEILALRRDAEMSRQMVELYALENGRALTAAGLAVNDASLYLAHFLGPGGAVDLLSAPSSTPVSQILGADQINANASILEGQTAGQVLAWAQEKMGITNAELAAQEHLAQIDQERLETVQEYNDAYAQRVDDQQFDIEAMRMSDRAAAVARAIREEEQAAAEAGIELGESDRVDIARRVGAQFDAEAVRAAQEYNEEYQERIANQEFSVSLQQMEARDAAIASALREEENLAREQGLRLSQEQRDQITAIAAAEYDRANVETQINGLMEERATLMERLAIAQENGDESTITETIARIQEIDAALPEAIEAAIAFWSAMGGPDADAAIERLRNAGAAIGDIVEEMSTKYLPTAESLNTQIVEMGGNAFSAFAEALATGKNAWEAFANSMLQGLADIVIGLGKAIVQQALFNALTGGGATPGGGIGGTISALVATIFHGGGLVSAGGAGTRMVNPAVFSNASRYHNGGGPNLNSDERAAILLKNEEVLTADDPRHITNGGGRAAPVNVKNVNVFDPVAVLEAALSDEAGERVVMNFMSRRARMVNGALAT